MINEVFAMLVTLSFENNQKSQWELSSATWLPLVTCFRQWLWEGGVRGKYFYESHVGRSNI